MTRGKPTAVPDPKQEFRDLLRVSGWTQAEAARQLAMTPSALSQIVRRNSPVRPSPVTLRLFRLLLLSEKGGKTTAAEPQTKSLGPNEPWAHHLYRELSRLDPKLREMVLSQLLAVVKAAQSSGGKRMHRVQEAKH